MKIRIHRYSEEQKEAVNKDLSIGAVNDLYQAGFLKSGLLIESGMVVGTIDMEEK